jgi:hypothetical protein
LKEIGIQLVALPFFVVIHMDVRKPFARMESLELLEETVLGVG